MLDRIVEPYHVSLDGNEQYEDMAGVAELWRRMKAERRLARLVSSIVFIEQPVKRSAALERPVEGIEKPVIIDESDDSLDAFPRAKALGYKGVSSKPARDLQVAHQPGALRTGRQYFMTGEDLTFNRASRCSRIGAGIAAGPDAPSERPSLRQRMAGPAARRAAGVLTAHPDLYEQSHGACACGSRRHASIDSLDCPGYASRALPDWNSMKEMP